MIILKFCRNCSILLDEHCLTAGQCENCNHPTQNVIEGSFTERDAEDMMTAGENVGVDDE